MRQTASSATATKAQSTREISLTEVEPSTTGKQAFSQAANRKTAISERALARVATACALTLVSALLLVLSFPDFNLWPLAWIGFVPLLVTLARSQAQWRAFLSGWLAGTVFFYMTCYWLTYSMIHYGGLHAWQSYLLLLPGPLVSGLFPAFFALVLARALRRCGTFALLLAPPLWVAFEWARLSVTGQLWNAIGYSQAFHPVLIQVARLGGVYAVGFLIVAVNAAVAYALVRRTARAIALAALILAGVFVAVLLSNKIQSPSNRVDHPALRIVALQPNVPMDPVKSAQQMQDLVTRHLVNSENALGELPPDDAPRLLIWPESPMNFSYGTNSQFRDLVGQFAQRHHTSVLFNSQEPAPDNGFYNSALLINEEGRLIAQYDKIRLMPFGEYVPLPRWLPGSDQIRAIVGEFTPGSRYVLMPVGKAQAGVFICIESAYPQIARTFAAEGADVLINISNDGYLGPTAVMRQHLANAIFRSVENGRPLLRVTNTGITAFIAPSGAVTDSTPGFQTAVRTWTVSPDGNTQTFYTKHGDLFVGICAALTVFVFVLTFTQSETTKPVSRTTLDSELVEDVLEE
jgi:apolipoprotein N-acyltransferase